MHEQRTLIDVFHQRWREPAHAELPALLSDEGTLSYGALHERVGALAGALRAAGVQPGQRVALAMERSLDLALLLLATMAAGACPCPLEPKLGREETARRNALAGFDWTVCDAAHDADPTLADVPRERRLQAARLRAEAATAPPAWALALPPLADSFLLFTSGSSGRPKGVLQNHRGMLANALGVAAHTGLGPHDRLLHLMPLHHTNGVNNQLLAPLLAGAAVVLCGRFRADEVPALMARWQPSIVTGVPTMFARLLPLDLPREALASLRILRCGSAPITEELHRRIEAKFGIPLVVSYGLSEATCTSTMNPPRARRVGTVGTVLAGQRVFLRDGDGQIVERAGAEGEICIAGPALMSGYLDDSTPGRPRPPGELLRTGDLGRFDADGYLSVTGRLKDVIIRGGENLSPGLIEEALAAVPGVRACCVVGKADADMGEVPVAFVVRNDDIEGSSLEPEHLRAAVVQRLSRIHQPVEVRFVDALPENAVGKVDRKRLALLLGAPCHPERSEGPLCR